MAANPPRRLRIQVYVDVLRAIYASHRKNELTCFYGIERSSGLTYPRLKACLSELEDAGLLRAPFAITDRGYVFLEEVSGKVAPVLAKYGFWRGRP